MSTLWTEKVSVTSQSVESVHCDRAKRYIVSVPVFGVTRLAFWGTFWHSLCSMGRPVVNCVPSTGIGDGAYYLVLFINAIVKYSLKLHYLIDTRSWTTSQASHQAKAVSSPQLCTNLNWSPTLKRWWTSTEMLHKYIGQACTVDKESHSCSSLGDWNSPMAYDIEFSEAKLEVSSYSHVERIGSQPGTAGTVGMDHWWLAITWSDLD